MMPSPLESTKYGPPMPTKALTSLAPMVITFTCLVPPPAICTVCGVPLCANANWPLTWKNSDDRHRDVARDLEQVALGRS